MVLINTGSDESAQLNYVTTRPKTFMTDDCGAVDMPSTLVTALVLAFLAGAIVLGVFKVVPWAQDTIAKHDVESVATAMNAQQLLSSEGRYSTLDELVSTGLIREATKSKVKVIVFGSETPANSSDDAYQIDVKSGTGKVYRLHSSDRVVRDVSGDSPGDAPIVLPLHEVHLDGAVFKAQEGVKLNVTRNQTGNTVTYLLNLSTDSVAPISTRTVVDWSGFSAKTNDPTPADLVLNTWKVYGAYSIAPPTVASKTYTTSTSDVSWQWAGSNVSSSSPVAFTYQVEGR